MEHFEVISVEGVISAQVLSVGEVDDVVAVVALSAEVQELSVVEVPVAGTVVVAVVEAPVVGTVVVVAAAEPQVVVRISLAVVVLVVVALFHMAEAQCQWVVVPLSRLLVAPLSQQVVAPPGPQVVQTGRALCPGWPVGQVPVPVWSHHCLSQPARHLHQTWPDQLGCSLQLIGPGAGSYRNIGLQSTIEKAVMT